MGSKGKRGNKLGSAEKTTLGLGSFFIGLGLLSILIAVFRIIEVQKAEDFFMTDAVVTYVELKEADLSSAQVKYINTYRDAHGFDPYIERDHYYRSNVEAVLDGKTYKGVYYSEDAVSVGETVSVPAFKKAGGGYKIINPLKYDFAQYIVVGAIAVVIGLGLVLMTFISKSLDKNGNRKSRNKKG